MSGERGSESPQAISAVRVLSPEKWLCQSWNLIWLLSFFLRILSGGAEKADSLCFFLTLYLGTDCRLLGSAHFGRDAEGGT